MNWWENMPKFRGVNLGSWLVLERWQLESLFSGTDCWDEYSLTSHLGSQASSIIHKHRETYIQEEDFKWLSKHGINAVRIPLGYWILKEQDGFIASPEVLDFAVECCEKYNIHCFLDLHALPGHQSSEHHCGRKDFFRWSKDDLFLSKSLDFIEELSERYSRKNCIRGISLVNEPAPSIPANFLLTFFRQAYMRIRRHLPYDKTSVIITAFPENRLDEIHGKLNPPEFENIMDDIHYYQCFGDWWRGMPANEHLQAPLTCRLPEIEKYSRNGWLVVGEWSLALPTDKWGSEFNQDPYKKDLYMRSFAANQLLAYEQAQGWFFWSYKAEKHPEWSFRDCVERGWMPNQF